MTKQELFNEGVRYVIEFCKVNNIKMPKIVAKDNKSYFPAPCGFYNSRNKTIYVCIEKCSYEVNNPGYRWSHRHYFADREPCGVVCHEFGHYLHHILTNCKLVLPRERKITSYEPNNNERFAETIKLFMLNPDLLKQYDPRRYDVIVNVLKLKPIIHTDWKTTFGDNINEKFINACKAKLNKK